jgi:hypothetical protein
MTLMLYHRVQPKEFDTQAMQTTVCCNLVVTIRLYICPEFSNFFFLCRLPHSIFHYLFMEQSLRTWTLCRLESPFGHYYKHYYQEGSC